MSEICPHCKLGPCRVNAKKCEGLRDDLEALSTPVRTDWYGGGVARSGGEVSFELAARLEIYLKNELDQQVEDENIFDQGGIKNGLPPCKRVKKSL